MKIKNILIIFFATIFLMSCQGAKDAFQGKKRSQSNEEFLVKKKIPLTTPPDIDELPVPLDEQEQGDIASDDEPEIKKILEIEGGETETQSSSNDSSLEQSILEKINN